MSPLKMYHFQISFQLCRLMVATGVTLGKEEFRVELLPIPVKINANDEVYVAFKDGSVSNKASVMKFNVSICGDGIVSGSEQCDDGNDDPNDGCDNCTIYIDQDQDGYFSNLDCDDSNPLIYPGAPEIIDGIDNDCDALVDYDDNDCQLNDESIQTAVNLWEVNPSEAEQIYGHISSWNTSCVTNMSYLCYDFQDFNEDIGNWDVSNVTDMSYMFFFAIDFDQDISDWNVGNVTNMEVFLKPINIPAG